MSFKTKFISTVGLALAVGTFSIFVAAQDTTTTTTQTDSTRKERKFDGMGGKRMRDGRHGGDRMMMGALRQLNLTDAQKAQVKAIFEANKPDQTQFAQVRSLKEKKHSGTALTADEQATFDAFKAQRKANAELIHSRILAVLTAEQRAQLAQLKQQKGENRGYGHRKGMKSEDQTPNTTDNN